jgi:hypothetical protein
MDTISTLSRNLQYMIFSRIKTLLFQVCDEPSRPPHRWNAHKRMFWYSDGSPSVSYHPKHRIPIPTS